MMFLVYPRGLKGQRENCRDVIYRVLM